MKLKIGKFAFVKIHEAIAKAKRRKFSNLDEGYDYETQDKENIRISEVCIFLKVINNFLIYNVKCMFILGYIYV